MKKLSAKFLISLGLVVFMMGLLMLAFELEFLPNPMASRLKARAHASETMAVNASILANKGDFESIQMFFRSVSARDAELRSAGLRRVDGTIVASTDEHDSVWAEETSFPTETRVEVPIYSSKSNKWGVAEFAYQPISQSGWLGVFANPTVRFLSFVVPLSFFAFYFYLGKMLKVVNAKSVPQRVRTALNTLAGGLIVMDQHGDIVLANDVVTDWVGRGQDQLVGTKVDALPWGKELTRSDAPWNRTMSAREAVVGSTATLHAKQGDRALIINSSPMIGHRGELRGVFIGLEDVTVLQEKEIEHKRLREEAEQANSAKSEFLARMSHEIRTPMNAILGFTDVLRRNFDKNESERSEYLNTIHSSGEHLLSLINDILDLSKVEAGHVELEERKVSPHKIILETLQVLKVRAEEKSLTLSYEPSDDIPEFINTDPVRLRQIVTNLVGNAIKFTDQGGVRVVSTMADGKFEFSVVDTGIGIKQEALGKIFNPFSQADNSITRRFGGTGLGLAIAKRFSEMMGGGIRVASKEGKGTAFTVQINPGALDSIRRISRTQALEASSSKSDTVVEVKLPACRILIVDDGESNRRLLRLFLQRAGAELVEAENGLEALEAVTSQKFDAILMDMQMPVMDGHTATAKIRGMGCSTPIVALTAHAMAEDEAKCLASGCSHFLAKPVNTNKLMQLMGEVVGGEVSVVQPIARPSAVPVQPAAAATSNVASPVSNVASPALHATASTPIATAPAVPRVEAPSTQTTERITSDLPTEIEEFREIVAEFVDTLAQKRGEMQSAVDAGDYKQLADLAHWLKGSGGTVGFNEFTQPAATLEKMAKAGQPATSLQPVLEQIRSICDRIYVPEVATV